MSETTRRPVEMASLSPELSPQVLAWATELRAQFVALGMSLSLFAKLHPIDKGSVSRYLNGKRVPTDRWFLDQILALRAGAGAPVTEEVRRHLTELQLAALKVAHPHEYRVRTIKDDLAVALTSRQEAERYAQALEQQLRERTRTLEEHSAQIDRLRAAGDQDRARHQEEIALLTRHLKLARERAYRAERRVQALEDLLDQLEAHEPPWGEHAGLSRGRIRAQDATTRLAETLTVKQVVEVIAEIGRATLNVAHTHLALLPADPTAPSQTLTMISDETTSQACRVLGEKVPLSYPDVMTMAVNGCRPVFAESPDNLREQLPDQGCLERLLDDGERAWIALPLVAAERMLGALRFSFTRQREIEQDDSLFLAALADQCTSAVMRALVHEREYDTAEALKRSLHSHSLPVVDGLTLALRRLAGSGHRWMGGDLFDAFPLHDGRVAAVVGEAMGKGIDAATHMGRSRIMVRALALTNPPPAAVLTGLDRIFEATEEAEQLTTLAYMTVEPGTGEVALALAGHPPPVLISPQGTAVPCNVAPGTPLGWPTPRHQDALTIPPGHTALLYSDGLVTHRQRAMDAGLADLRSAVGKAPASALADPERLLDHLLTHMLGGRELDDDVTVLAVHIPARR
ncbi:PP2C family protein-serine/threonine phosphatase [Nonomuraea sp. NPDC046802]|uniref:PP2C family protein-serine/threonine phosphatase n=1 Tax=Nonomuraea sp. NPDC046802 TaxID=3154919 RepID=UPI0033EE45A3